MRTALLIISGTAALFFAASFASTFFARDYITRLAQDFVIDKTRRYSDPLVEIAAQSVEAPGIKLIVNDEQVMVVRAEIAKYRDDPRGYIARLVAGDGQPAVAVGPKAALAERVLGWKQSIREYFQQTLDRLIRDLRIFTGSNLVASVVAFAAAWWSRPGRRRGLMVVCGLLLASVAFSSYMYVDEFSYFKILFNSYMGWWYPVILAMTFLGLMVDYGRSPTTQSPDSASTKPSLSPPSATPEGGVDNHNSKRNVL